MHGYELNTGDYGLYSVMNREGAIHEMELTGRR